MDDEVDIRRAIVATAPAPAPVMGGSAPLGLAGWRGRLSRWLRHGVEFALNQGLAQIAGMVAGLIYVRVMPVDQYALYALSLGTLAFLSVGSDLGLTGALSYFWRQAAKDGRSVRPKINAIRMLRLGLLTGGAVLAAAMFLTGTRRPVTDGAVVACLVLLIATVWVQIHTSLELQLLRLRGLQRQSYYCEAAGNLTRLVLAGTMLLVGLQAAWFGLAAGLAGSLAVLAGAWWLATADLGASQSPDRSEWREIGAYMLPVLPGILVFMLQEPLILWLTARLGGDGPLSETFAAGRIGAVFVVIGQFVTIVVTPRLARIGDDAHFVRMLLWAVAGVIAIGAALIAVTALAPSLPLALIGPKYAHLKVEVMLVAAIAAVNVLAMLLILANRLRGWIRLDPIAALLQLASIAGLASLWSYTSAASVLTLSLILTVINCAIAAAIAIAGARWPGLVKVAGR